MAAAVRAHRDAWHPSSFTEAALERVRRTWPYRADLHALIEAADGTLAATAIAWLDEAAQTAEVAPVGTHSLVPHRAGRRTTVLILWPRTPWPFVRQNVSS